MAQYSDADLKELGRKVLAQKEREKMRIEARREALKRLIAAHEPEFKQFLAEENTRRGL